MRMLFKLYLLGQLIALPFLVGAIGSALNSSDSPDTNVPSVSQPGSEISADPFALTAPDGRPFDHTTSGQDICNILDGSPANSIHDEIQQLRFITGELYGNDAVEDCPGILAP